jgi:hypothetical protein
VAIAKKRYYEAELADYEEKQLINSEATDMTLPLSPGGESRSNKKSYAIRRNTKLAN